MAIDIRRNGILVFLLSSICAAFFLKNGLFNGVLIAFYCFCIFDCKRDQPFQLLSRTPLLFPVLLFIIYLCWTAFSEDKSSAVAELIKKSSLLLLPLGFTLTRSRLSEKEIELVLTVFVVMCLLGSLYCYGHALVNVLKNQSLYFDTVDRRYYYFSYQSLTEALDITPIYLSIFGNFSLSIVLLKYHPLNVWLKVVLCAYLIVFIILISSKIGILITVVIVSTYLIQSIRNKKKALVILAVFTGALILSIFNFSFLKQRFVSKLTVDYTEVYGHRWNSTAYRVAIWSCALEAIKDNALVGYGTADGQRALERVYKEKGFVRGEADRYNPHNEFLSTTLDLGLAGLIVLLLLVGASFVNAIRMKNKLLLYFIIIVFLSFCVESVLIRLKGAVFVSFFYSLLFWHLKSENKS